MQIIYMDTLFFLNATIDYMLLLSSARVAGEPLERLRFVFASVVGGLYGVAILMFPFLQGLLYKAMIYLVMILLAYGKSQRLLRQGLIFLALSFAFAGGIFGISLLGGEGLMLDGGVYYSQMDLKLVFLSASFCYLMLNLLFRNFGQHSFLAGELRGITLRIGDKVLPLTALVDTGNTLCDPLTGGKVLVVEGERMSPFFSTKIQGCDLEHPAEFLAQRQELQGRMRLLPYQVVGMQGMLLVLKVDEITVDGSVVKDTLVGLSATKVSDGGSYHALLSSG